MPATVAGSINRPCLSPNMTLRDVSFLSAFLGQMLGMLVGALVDDAEKRKRKEQQPPSITAEPSTPAPAKKEPDARPPESAP
jgi:hypothetical protein